MSITGKFNASELLRRLSWITSEDENLPHDPVTYDNLVHIDPDTLPPNWELIDYDPAGIQTNCIRARALNDDPTHKVTFFSGFKANMDVFDQPRVRALQRFGVEIDIIILPDPGKNVGYLHDNKAVVADTLVHNPPPGAFREGIPHFIFGHSLGGRAVLSNMLDDDFAEQVADNYDGFIGIAPHFTSPYRSKMLTSGLFAAYCKMFPDRTYGEAPLDWMKPAVEQFSETIRDGYAKVLRRARENKAKEYSPTTTGNTRITYGQIHYSNIEGENLHRRITEGGVPDAAYDFPMIFMGGKHDFVAAPEYIESMALVYGADYYEFDAYHHPLLESREARSLAIGAMRIGSDNWETALPLAYPGSYRDPNLAKEPEELPEADEEPPILDQEFEIEHGYDSEAFTREREHPDVSLG